MIATSARPAAINLIDACCESGAETDCEATPLTLDGTAPWFAAEIADDIARDAPLTVVTPRECPDSMSRRTRLRSARRSAADW